MPARRAISATGRARSIAPREVQPIRRRRRSRRAPRGRRRFRSPRSRTGCAIPTRSTPSTSCRLRAARRRSTRRPARADRGIVIHGAIGDFTEAFAAALPADPRGRAAGASGASTSRALDDYPGGACILVAALPAHRPLVRRVGERTPRRGSRALHRRDPRRDRNSARRRARSRCRARADRIERLADGSYAILDYKTGQVPTEKQVRAALRRSSRWKPRSCAAAVSAASRGRFGRRARLCGAQGRRARRRATRSIDFKDGDADMPMPTARSPSSRTSPRASRTTQQPYRSLVLPMWKSRYGDYDHLARVKEWSTGRRASEEGGEVE